MKTQLEAGRCRMAAKDFAERGPELTSSVNALYRATSVLQSSIQERMMVTK